MSQRNDIRPVFLIYVYVSFLSFLIKIKCTIVSYLILLDYRHVSFCFNFLVFNQFDFIMKMTDFFPI